MYSGNKFLREILSPADPAKRRRWAGAVVLLILVIGALDFLLGFELSIFVFYFLPVSLAVATLGWRAGVTAAVASVATWLVGDFAAGAHFANPLIPWWNALIVLVTYLVVVWLLSSLLALQREMEERIRQRTAALTDEIAERERLEKEILEVSERERRAVGRDLHDSLCQHLTGTALAGQVLGEKLEARQVPEAGDAKKIVALIEEAIDETRGLAKGLMLVQIEDDGLLAALEELASATSGRFRIECLFRFDAGVVVSDNTTASHLFRICQEAVRNAVRHGAAKRIEIILLEKSDGIQLTITDNGTGLPAEEHRHRGMGLRIMAHRAAMIGATFSIVAQSEGGTMVVCQLSNRLS